MSKIPRLSGIHYCRECKPSYHKAIKNLKNAYLENPDNVSHIAHMETTMAVLKDYAWKNVIKKPEDTGQLSRMAILAGNKWKGGRTLTCSFMGGDKEVRDRIIRHAKIWMNYANIELDFQSKKKNTDVRIAFDKKDGSWSYVGTEILSIDKTKPTMNFGWLTKTTDDIEYNRVVLHEFGHTLGCIHEHERGDNGIPWDKPKVYAYYKQTDGWSKEEVDAQVFEKYDMDMLRANKLDKKSIMMYPVPNELTIGDYEIGWNNNLSEGDKTFIAQMLPK